MTVVMLALSSSESALASSSACKPSDWLPVPGPVHITRLSQASFW